MGRWSDDEVRSDVVKLNSGFTSTYYPLTVINGDRLWLGDGREVLITAHQVFDEPIDAVNFVLEHTKK